MLKSSELSLYISLVPAQSIQLLDNESITFAENLTFQILIDHPVVLHIHTIKGKGLPYVEKDRESWHAGGPFHVEDGSPLYPYEDGESVMFNCLKEMLDTNGNAIVLNAATPMGLGFFQGVREEYVDRGQFIEVGIAEENAVAMAGGIARYGGTAVWSTITTTMTTAAQ